MPFVLHAGDPSTGLLAYFPLTIVLVVGLAVVGAAVHLFEGPLGRTNPRRFSTLGVLVALGVGALLVVDRAYHALFL